MGAGGGGVEGGDAHGVGGILQSMRLGGGE